MAMRVDLNVPFADKEQAKALGARWDPARKKWYAEDAERLEPLMKWMPEQRKRPAGARAVAVAPSPPLSKPGTVAARSLEYKALAKSWIEPGRCLASFAVAVEGEKGGSLPAISWAGAARGRGREVDWKCLPSKLSAMAGGGRKWECGVEHPGVYQLVRLRWEEWDDRRSAAPTGSGCVLVGADGTLHPISTKAVGIKLALIQDRGGNPEDLPRELARLEKAMSDKKEKQAIGESGKRDRAQSAL
jgi:hypothetical protein